MAPVTRIVGFTSQPSTQLFTRLTLRSDDFFVCIWGDNEVILPTGWPQKVSCYQESSLHGRPIKTVNKPKFHLLRHVTTRDDLVLAHAFWYRKKSHVLCRACCTASATRPSPRTRQARYATLFECLGLHYPGFSHIYRTGHSL